MVLKDSIMIEESFPKSALVVEGGERLVNVAKFEQLNRVMSKFTCAQLLSREIVKVPHLYDLLKALPFDSSLTSN
jgi:hypothetical protein